jgi:hypothetical protein
LAFRKQRQLASKAEKAAAKVREVAFRVKQLALADCGPIRLRNICVRWKEKFGGSAIQAVGRDPLGPSMP